MLYQNLKNSIIIFLIGALLAYVSVIVDPFNSFAEYFYDEGEVTAAINQAATEMTWQQHLQNKELQKKISTYELALNLPDSDLYVEAVQLEAGSNQYVVKSGSFVPRVDDFVLTISGQYLGLVKMVEDDQITVGTLETEPSVRAEIYSNEETIEVSLVPIDGGFKGLLPKAVGVSKGQPVITVGGGANFVIGTVAQVVDFNDNSDELYVRQAPREFGEMVWIGRNSEQDLDSEDE